MLGFHSSATEDVGHESLWLALVNKVRQPSAHAEVDKWLFVMGSLRGSHRQWELLFVRCR